ncbi:MAG: hypothetical protein JWL63_3187 [Rhodocyclales bacterium]|nr:hypothetical protein [Rhodocyclales bacterium]
MNTTLSARLSATAALTALAAICSLHVSSAHAQTLTYNQAVAAIAPLYDSLNKPGTKDIGALLAKSTTDDWKACVRDDLCVNREHVVKSLQSRGVAIPDLKWEIKEVLVVGDRAIVRSEASGTPVAQGAGLNPTGKAFRVMAIDIQTIRDGKISRSYHLEDWAAAAQQLSATRP